MCWGGAQDLLIQIVFPTKNSAGGKPAAIGVINTVETPFQPLQWRFKKKIFTVEDENLEVKSLTSEDALFSHYTYLQILLHINIALSKCNS